VEFLGEVGETEPGERGALSVEEASVAMGSAEAREGIRAFLERRPPRWPSAV
jgi:enoyl-CoA hydratase/carnithine racemase